MLGYAEGGNVPDGFRPTTPLQPGAPSTAQAEPGPDPTRVGSRPDPGFRRLKLKGGGPRPPRRRSAPASPGNAFAAWTAVDAPPSAAGGRRRAGPQTRGFPAPRGLRPVGDAGGGCALPDAASPPLPGNALADWPRLRAREGAGACQDPSWLPARPGLRPGGPAAPPPASLGDFERAG